MVRQHQSPWMLRYRERHLPVREAAVLHHDDPRRRITWSTTRMRSGPSSTRLRRRGAQAVVGRAKGKEWATRPPWLPDGTESAFGELPKWTLLGDVLHGIEEEMVRHEPMLSSRTSPPPLSPVLRA